MTTRPNSILTQTAPPSYKSRLSTPIYSLARDEETASFTGANSSSSSLVTLAGPITLSWDRDDDSVLRDVSDSQLPTNNIKYGFRQVSVNAMALTSGTGPVYHISVASNCFIPSAFVTTIRGGGSENGTFIADFQTGVVRDSYVPEVVCMHGEEHLIAAVMKDVSLSWKQKRNGLFKLGHWQFGDTNLYWDISPQSNLKHCYTSPKVPRTKATLLARFESSGRLRNGGEYLTTLEVTPEGHNGVLLEHILVSASILERLWLTPDAGRK